MSFPHVFELSNNTVRTFVLDPHASHSVVVRFSPTAGAPSSAALVLRNNLTIVELVRLSGVGGKYTFAFPKVCFLLFPIDTLCLLSHHFPIYTLRLLFLSPLSH